MVWRIVGESHPYSYDPPKPIPIKEIQIRINSDGVIQQYYLINSTWVELHLIYTSLDEAKEDCEEKNKNGWW